jgi:hypothetical protein
VSAADTSCGEADPDTWCGTHLSARKTCYCRAGYVTLIAIAGVGGGIGAVIIAAVRVIQVFVQWMICRSNCRWQDQAHAAVKCGQRAASPGERWVLLLDGCTPRFALAAR